MTDYNSVIPDPKDLPIGSLPWARKLTELARAGRITNEQTQNAMLVIQKQQDSIYVAIENQAENVDNINRVILPTEATAPPTDPTLESSMNAIAVYWDGQTIDGGETSIISHVIVEASLIEVPGPEEDDPYRQVGSIVTGGTSFAAADIGAVQGDTVWVRLRTVTYNGLMSDPSTSISIVVQGVDLAELAPDVYDAIINAQTTADGKNSIFAQETEPVEDPEAPFVQGDQWWVVDPLNPNGFSGVKIWNGTSWVNFYFVADSIVVPGSVGPIVIADGAITSPKISAYTIEADRLSPSVGPSLDISANGSINLLVGTTESLANEQQNLDGRIENLDTDINGEGGVAEVAAGAKDTADAANATANIANAQAQANNEVLEPLAQTYRFTTTGAFIGAPGSPYEFVIQNTGAKITFGGEDVSTWDSEEMWVQRFRGNVVQLGVHQIETYEGGGTVVRALT